VLVLYLFRSKTLGHEEITRSLVNSMETLSTTSLISLVTMIAKHEFPIGSLFIMETFPGYFHIIIGDCSKLEFPPFS
jgi:hypothetical protein